MTKFNSHIKNLRIVIAPAQPIFEGGVKVGDRPGRYAQFADGRFETDDAEVVEKLKSLPTFGIDFFEASNEAESKPASVEPDLESLTKQELLALADEKKIEVDEKLTKAEILERLKAK